MPSRVRKDRHRVLLKGMGASGGIAAGYARIVRDPTQVNRIHEGDILVTEMTNPMYVIAILKAAAIVTDVGGLLSHAAIIARELGIPCVVGTNTATKTLKDGERIRVNGNEGLIYAGD
jgi:pyruvate,water dikinase